jgi:hypothetical protein
MPSTTDAPQLPLLSIRHARQNPAGISPPWEQRLLTVPSTKAIVDAAVKNSRPEGARMSKPLHGMVALVTDGSRALGAATARSLADAGADVAITWVASADRAAEVVKELEDKGVQGRRSRLTSQMRRWPRSWSMTSWPASLGRLADSLKAHGALGRGRWISSLTAAWASRCRHRSCRPRAGFETSRGLHAVERWMWARRLNSARSSRSA